jgi:hypothetical protein
MTRLAYFLASLFLVTSAFFTLACGSNSSQHVLESVTVSPASADAQNYPNGQVPFTATGAYNTSPTNVTLQNATWGVALATASTNQVSITSSGMAQCAPGAVGIFSVGAWDVMHNNGATCTVVGPYGEPACNAVLGTAQLTCP